MPFNTILEYLPFQCKNTDYGCTEIFMETELFDHEKYCDYQRVNCANLSCKTEISFLNLVDHFGEFHARESKAFEDANKRLKLPFTLPTAQQQYQTQFNWKPTKLTAFNQTFFEVGLVKENMMFRWIYVLALPDQAEQYFYDLVMEKDSGEKMRYYGQVRSLVESDKEVMANEAFIVGMTAVKRFVSEDNGQIKYSVKLRCLKEEAKDEDEESGIDDE